MAVVTAPITDDPKQHGTPCSACPWRVENHGRKNEWGFYTPKNRKRLWNQIRGADRSGECRPQSCHPTDPGHPDHIAAGAKPGSVPKECPGSVILVYREIEKIIAAGAGTGREREITPEGIKAYQKAHRDGLTNRGILYWVMERITYGGVPFVGGPKLPDVDVNEAGIGR